MGTLNENDVNIIMEDIINEKYQELNSTNEQNDRFVKIKTFEGNAIGQIGENFVKKVFRSYNIPMLDLGKEIVHDEYDLISNNMKIEVKTARKGIKNNTFQFNGINPIYNHDYIFLIGITTNHIYYKIIDGHSIYDHTKRKHYLSVNGRRKQLVSMNPGNVVNYKLTLNLSDLDDIANFVDELKDKFQVIDQV